MIRVEKGQGKKVNLRWPKDRQENPISAQSTHIGALSSASSFWPRLSNFSQVELIVMVLELVH